VMNERKKGVLVVGIGNEYRRDDGIGVVVARHLKSMIESKVDVVEASDASSLIDMMELGYKKMVIVDAIHSNVGGVVYRFRKEEILKMGQYKQQQQSSTHAMDVAEAIKLAVELGVAKDMDVVMFGVEGNDFGFGEGLSKEVMESVNRVVDEIIKEIGEHNNNA